LRLDLGSGGEQSGSHLAGRRWTDKELALLADLSREGLKVCSVNGRDSPELFLADDPRTGVNLTNDQITHKVRFEFGVCIVNWRPFAGYMT
jgi:hypothetical protein